MVEFSIFGLINKKFQVHDIPDNILFNEYLPIMVVITFYNGKVLKFYQIKLKRKNNVVSSRETLEM